MNVVEKPYALVTRTRYKKGEETDKNDLETHSGIEPHNVALGYVW